MKERAFPSAAHDDRYGGMTLWDYYAGQAMTAVLAEAPHHSAKTAEIPAIVARVCAQVADAMMAERARRLAAANG